MEAIICQHVLAGTMPDMLIIEEAALVVASCHPCAQKAEETGNPDEFTAVCKHSHPALPLWNVDAHFPSDGCYQLIDGQYYRQPDMPECGNA